jgi:class 3 adenylate cyclase/pimeloyl-ACP methyl ester carboxylesterase
MEKVRLRRHLAAILVADVANYSRLMGSDEEGTHAGLMMHLRVLGDPKINEHGGRIIKNTGDGFLAEFASAVEAVNCAVEIQRGMAERNADVPPDKRLEFRMGINVGDVIDDEGDIFGDGVNVAVRLESVSEPGGVCISRQVLDQVEGKLPFPIRELGRRNLKNISHPVEIYAVGFDEKDVSPATRILATAKLRQNIKYCRAPDGVRLAYATVGSGPPLMRSAHWLGHLEYDWELPIFRHFLLNLASTFSLTRYDARGNGLSDWNVGELFLDAWVSDMETVSDAAGLDCFPLLGVSQGCAVSIAFSVKHPERVTHLILLGGFATGANRNPHLTPADRERFAAMKTLMKLGWGSDDPTFRQLFTSSMIPGATKEQADAFNELQRVSASPESAVRYIETVSDFDIRHLLPKVRVPTLVMHVRDDRRVPLASGRELAALIPGARFVSLPGKNHIMLEQDAGGPIFLEEMRSFLSKG